MKMLRCNKRCSGIIANLLDLVQNKMLQVNSAHRIRADELDKQLKEILETAKADTAYPLGD